MFHVCVQVEEWIIWYKSTLKMPYFPVLWFDLFKFNFKIPMWPNKIDFYFSLSHISDKIRSIQCLHTPNRLCGLSLGHKSDTSPVTWVTILCQNDGGLRSTNWEWTLSLVHESVLWHFHNCIGYNMSNRRMAVEHELGTNCAFSFFAVYV